MPHDLFVAKFEAYGINKTGLNLINNYLFKFKQRTKINSSFSDWYYIVPQEPILGPLLFKLFINDLILFIERTNICNIEDDNTIYNCRNDLKTILEDLRYVMITLLRWIKENSMRANPKIKLNLNKTPRQRIILNISQIKVEESQKVVLLGLTIDNRLTFVDMFMLICYVVQLIISS